jgi:para-nitrobenzyl esterase
MKLRRMGILLMIMSTVACSGAGNSNASAATAERTVDVVAVEGGSVQGVETDVDGVQVFKGIPFAGSTAGENRWRAPQPVEAWEGVRLCDSWGDQVMQNVNLNPVGTFWGDEFYFDPAFAPKASEQGLNLNVFTPAKTPDDKLPVFMYIHGGGNDHGHASEMEFYASQLAAKGILVVTVQYRVGLFGGLALKELSQENPNGVSGNYCVLDLIKALQWIHEYIAGFGGDPARITVGGQSAGAMNTTALLSSPLAEGLFQRAIIQSGFRGFLSSQLPPLAKMEADCASAIEAAFGKAMTLEELRTVPAEEFLIRRTPDGSASLYDAISQIAKWYTLDGYVFTEESVDLLNAGALNGYDIMIGGTSDEFTSLMGGETATMPMTEFASKMQAVYGNDYPNVYRPSDEREAYRMHYRSRSDKLLQMFVVSAQVAKIRNDDLDIYTYYFNHTPPGRNAEFYGSYHSSELWYTMSSLRNTPGQRFWTGADYRMADTISSYFANFVKTGDPNGPELTQWEQCTAASGGAFMRWHEGYAYNVTTTPYPMRDALNRKVVLKSVGMTEADIAR